MSDNQPKMVSTELEYLQWAGERITQLEAENIDSKAKLFEYQHDYMKLEARNARLQEALLEAKVTLESIDDNHPQTEYALKKAEKALE